MSTDSPASRQDRTDQPADHTQVWHTLSKIERDSLQAIGYLETQDLARDDPHGLAIRDVLEARYDDRVSNGQLYPKLTGLAQQGLVNKASQDSRANAYTLTRTGRRLLAAAARDLDDASGIQLADGAATDGGEDA